MRNLSNVLDQLVAVEPSLEVDFRSVCSSIPFCAPEAIGRLWQEAQNLLIEAAEGFPEEVQVKLRNIWNDVA